MDLIEIFKTGVHTASQGQILNVTKADLDRIVANFDPNKHDVPVVIGHPKSDHPAWAWVKSLIRIGEKLFYQEKDTVPAFDEMRRLKMFKKRSISLYPGGMLKHVGWLGAQPPAIKGLNDANFAAANCCDTFEFSENEEGIVQEYNEKLESQFAEEDQIGQEIADIANQWSSC